MLPFLIAAVPSPSPTPSNFDADAVTPGVWGFVITAAVGLAVILIVVDMIRRLRRLNYRAEIRERLENEAAADGKPGASAGGAVPPDVDADGTGATPSR